MGLGQYILSITVVAMICSLACSFVEGGFAKTPVRMLCGCILALTIVQPFHSIMIPDISSWLESYMNEAAHYADEGREAADSSVSEIIKQQTEAYILDKANRFNADLTVEISLQEYMPVSVNLSGQISPVGKMQMELMLENDLGIAKEHIVWQ